MNSSHITTNTPLPKLANHYERNLVFFVNGRRHEIVNPDPRTLLVDYLRSNTVCMLCW